MEGTAVGFALLVEVVEPVSVPSPSESFPESVFGASWHPLLLSFLLPFLRSI